MAKVEKRVFNFLCLDFFCHTLYAKYRLTYYLCIGFYLRKGKQMLYY